MITLTLILAAITYLRKRAAQRVAARQSNTEPQP